MANNRDKFREDTIIDVCEGPYFTNSPWGDEKLVTRIASDGFCQLPISFAMKISKIIFIGDVNVGKTSVIHRFTHDSFCTGYKPTIGVDFHMILFKILTLPFSLQIWDTAGQERFRAIAGSYYRNSHAIVVVFDATNDESLQNCYTWMSEAVRNNLEKPYRFLVANKIEKLDQTRLKIVKNQGSQVASELGAEFWPISALSGENVARLFRRIACLCFTHVLNESRDFLRVTLGADKDLQKPEQTPCSGHQSCK